MLFNSLPFALFFVVVTVLYFLLPHRYRWFLLLAASCFFYMFFKPVYILILAFTIVIDYYAGILIENSPPGKKKRYLVMSLVANIGILAMFKYYNFLNTNITEAAQLPGYKNLVPFLKIALPIGLSFHTFQAMSYTIEVYRGNQPAERHFGIYALYNGIQVVMVSPPCYYEIIPYIKNYKEIDSMLHSISSTYNVPFIDYTNDTMSHSKAYFYNSQHLNKTGAELFSHKVAADVKRYMQ